MKSRNSRIFFWTAQDKKLCLLLYRYKNNFVKWAIPNFGCGQLRPQEGQLENLKWKAWWHVSWELVLIKGLQINVESKKKYYVGFKLTALEHHSTEAVVCE